MTEMALYVVVPLALTGVLAAALSRDLRRAVARQRIRSLTVSFAQFEREVGERLLPTMRKIAASAETMVKLIRETAA